jgi:DNA-directed RNA polymerase I, II, and III subunit RPABC2
MDDATIDIEEVPDNGDYLQTDEEYESFDEKEYDEPEVVDVSKTLSETIKKTTNPYLTKYERTQLISLRAQQLNMGAIPMVNVGKMKRTVEIAEKELMERKIPLMVRRPLPNGKYEDWKIDELIIE